MTVLVPCRDAVADEIPTSPRRVAKAATEAGWRVRTTYALAEITTNAGLDKTVESVLVRLRRWPLAAVGCWWNGKFELAYVWSAFSPPRRIGARELAVFVKAVTS